MSPRTIQFLAYSAFSVVVLTTGYTARRRGWVREELSRPIHFHTVAWVWSAACLLSLWRIPLRPENLWLVIIQPLLMATAAGSAIGLAKVIGCTRAQTGTMALAAGMGNNGFTLGAYLCYSVLEPAEEALAYASAFVTVTTLSVMLLFYPLARHFSPRPRENGSTLGLVLKSFIDLRAAPLYGAALGVVLAVTHVPFPVFVQRWHLMDVLFYLSGFGGYFGIGLRLRLGDSRAYLKHHAVLAAIKFLALPLAAMGLLWLVGLSAYPLGPVGRHVVQIEAATPVAIMTVMLANVFHLDARMASVVWVWNTLLFVVVVLPVILWLTT